MYAQLPPFSGVSNPRGLNDPEFEMAQSQYGELWILIGPECDCCHGDDEYIAELW